MFLCKYADAMYQGSSRRILTQDEITRIGGTEASEPAMWRGGIAFPTAASLQRAEPYFGAHGPNC